MKERLLSTLFVSAALLALAIPANGQIAQDKPGLCGLPGASIPLPDGITASSDPDLGVSTLTIARPGSPAPATLRFAAGRVDEVRPLAAGRLLIFGFTGVCSSIAIVDRNSAKLDDSFDADALAVSPDRHWLLFRAFYPPQTEMPFSDEYLLYDLTKDAAGNTAPDRPPYTENLRGHVVYPAVKGGTPFEQTFLPANQMHYFPSRSFYWAPDSSAVVFADGVEKTLSIVMVQIGSGVPQAFVRPVAAAEACEQESANLPTLPLRLIEATVGPAKDGDRTIEVQFESSDMIACRPRALILHPDEFKAAELEVHTPIQRPGIPKRAER